jgi:hypothetical protein
MLALFYFSICIFFGILSIKTSQSKRPILFLLHSIFFALTYYEVPNIARAPHIGVSEFFLIIYQLHLFDLLFLEQSLSPSSPFVGKRRTKCFGTAVGLELRENRVELNPEPSSAPCLANLFATVSYQSFS